MKKQTKSTTLYKTPFSASYWRDAAAEMKDTRMLVFAALMIALRVALKLVAIPLAPNLKINTAFLANAMGAMVFGPVMAIAAAFVSDFLGVMISGDLYFPPFCLTEIAGSLIFALFLYRAKVTPTRVTLSRFCICLFVNILLQTPLKMLYYQVMAGGKSYVLTVPHILKNLFMFPIESVVLTLFLSFIQPFTYRAGLTYDPQAGRAKTEEIAQETPAPRFARKDIAVLVSLFLVGCISVTAYLNYYYNHTSLTVAYTTQERIEKNKQMDALLEGQAGERTQPSVAIIESAYQKFLGKEVTYTVALYAADSPETAQDDATWALKKTPASKNPALTRLGTATIVRNERTGDVVSVDYTPLNCNH